MKKIISIITTTIVIILFFLLIILKKEYFSENENRYLEEFPDIKISDILSGDFQDSFSNYVSDHFPFREFFLKLKNTTEHILGNNRISGIYYGKDDYLIEEYKEPLNTDKIIRIINRFVDNNKNINIEFMLAPTSIYVNSDKITKYNISSDESKTIDYYKNNLNTKFIDVRDNLIKHNKEYIYYRTDHHWTTEGAYYAYETYWKENNLKIINANYKKVTNDFYGTIYSKLLDNSIKKDYISIVEDNTNYEVYINNKKTNSFYQEEFLDKKDKYSYFFGGNKALIHIVNNNEQGDLLIIKDSYANSFIPLIARNYKNIYVIDPRYYKDDISKFINKNNIHNVLFLYNVLTIDEDIGIVSINK